MLCSILLKSMIMWLYAVVLLLTSPEAHGHNFTDIQSGNLTENIQIPKCPGECVHLLTSWLCDHILEQAECETQYLRCCVSEDMTYGTEVVTSPPLPEDQESLPPVSTTLPPPTTISVISTALTTATAISSLTVPTISTAQSSQCSGVCVEKSHLHNCGTATRNTVCDNSGKICCSDFISTTPPPLSPPCPGSCVSPLFSLLCDHVALDYHCEDGSRCCLPPPQITTTPAPPGPCPGECIPTFLSGMCNRPYELILKTTDCNAGNICCYNPIPTTKLIVRPTRLPAPTPAPAPVKKTISSTNYICPGTCIDTFLRFTCIREHMVYEGFNCTTPNTVCCAPVDDVMKFQQKTRRQPPTFILYTNISNREQATTVKTPLSRIRNPYICGIKGNERRQGRITGGTDSSSGEWCWQVALINSQNQYLCGGTLIGTQWVLTAAHCITNIVKNGDAIYVRAGESDLTQRNSGSASQTKRVITTYIHHNHNSQTLDNDIALLKIQTPLELTKTVCLVCLPARGVTRQAGKRCTVTGYGYQGEGGPIALKIRETQVPIVDERECTVQINAVTEKLFVLPASSFCAGGEEGNDACQGDGGGPLVCEVDGFYELSGIVSWGFGCGRPNMPGIYVKVSSFIGWINQIVSVNNL